MAIRWSQYLASLLFYPFASLLSTFLYFDLAQRQQALYMEHLEKFSNQLFGTDINEKAVADKEATEQEIIETPVAEIVNPEPSAEEKDK